MLNVICNCLLILTWLSLGVHKYPRLHEALRPQVYNDTAQLECTFMASDYDYPHFIQSVWRKGLNLIMSNPRFVQSQPSWRYGKLVTKLIISQVTPHDSGEYFCSINYNTDIIKEIVSSNHGKILLDIGNTLNLNLRTVHVCDLICENHSFVLAQIKISWLYNCSLQCCGNLHFS